MKYMLKKVMAGMIAAVMMFMFTAVAENSLTAYYSDGSVYVEWHAVGDCVLTVYRNEWPISVCSVRGEDGGAVIPVGEANGNYTVRLQSNAGCVTADVSMKQEGNSAPVPTSNVEVKPTVTPMMTSAPTAVPVVTAVPTGRPTEDAGQQISGLAAQVVAQTNAERAKYGLPELTVSSELTRAACVRAREIVEKFSHTRPDGTSWSSVSAQATGENIAKGHNSADRVMAAWMSSEGHRANILRERFGSIGVCALEANGVIYWVQLFGR